MGINIPEGTVLTSATGLQTPTSNRHIACLDSHRSRETTLFEMLEKWSTECG